MSITHAKVAADPEVPLLNDADWNAAHVGAPTLAEALAAGNDPDTGTGAAIQAAATANAAGAVLGVRPASGFIGGGVRLHGGDATTDDVAMGGGDVVVYSGGAYGAVAANDGATITIDGGTSGNAGSIHLQSGGYYTAPDSNDGVEVEIRGATATHPGLVFLNLPTSDPAVAGALWSNAGVVMVSGG